MCFIFFVKQKTAYEMRISDWSSDVCSSDLRQFAVMIMTHQHKHLILTKRSARMREYLSRHRWHLWSAIGRDLDHARWAALPPIMSGDCTPVPHVWLGVSIEDRARMIERAYALRKTPPAGHLWSEIGRA